MASADSLSRQLTCRTSQLQIARSRIPLSPFHLWRTCLHYLTKNHVWGEKRTLPGTISAMCKPNLQDCAYPSLPSCWPFSKNSPPLSLPLIPPHTLNALQAPEPPQFREKVLLEHEFTLLHSLMKEYSFCSALPDSTPFHWCETHLASRRTFVWVPNSEVDWVHF